jgi:uncharacterized SAM-binding protein YcdF (DUF218 family)/glycosyltransferase involved in cell wall biosynthesis
MLKNENIICVSSIDWDFIWQGHQEIMTRLARNGNRVLFIENTGVRPPTMSDLGRIKSRIANWRKGLHGIRKLEDGLYVYSPLVLPFPYLKIARFINKRLMLSVLRKWLKAVGFSEPIVWAFLPTGLSLDIIDEIDPKVLVYYCIDSFEASSKDARKIKDTEKLLLKRSDLVFATSQELLRHCSEWNKNIHYFPFGVNIENFKRVLHAPAETPHDIKGLKRPIVGYVGGIHKWIDFELVRFVAEANENASFVFCGPLQTDISQVQELPNTIFLGQKDKEDLPRYVKEFDVAIIPYRITDYTRNVYPTKLNEYLSMGKPVIATDLPEIEKFNSENGQIVRIARTKDDFARNVKKAIAEPPGEKDVSRAYAAAEKNSWTSKVEEMSLLIEAVEREKTRQKEASWKDNLARLYKKTRKKFLPVATAAALIYLVLFHTPLVWVLGEPLIIKNQPAKVDLIAALGAGVGESGKAGQSCEERVISAVNLYKSGYAGKILYSSGYSYVMREARVMKALSVSLGVAPDNVILDETPENTRDMILHLGRIMRNSGWKTVIIVSPPYHMLRVKLLCDRYLEGERVLYVPIEGGSYYSRGAGVRIKHIRGILHEYLAILYYRWKGYI